MPRRQLLATLLATMLLASGLAGATDPPTTENVAAPFSVLANSSITCSTAWPSSTTGCWWEKRVLTLGDFEVAIAVDAAVTFSTGDWYVSPMLSLAWYGPSASVWLEAALPDGILPLPHVGRSDYVRIGFSYSIP